MCFPERWVKEVLIPVTNAEIRDREDLTMMTKR